MAGEPILIVDDTPVNLKLTRILLINEGYKVLTASSAEEALDLLRTYHPDLVLADIQLPGIDGLELTRRIKANQTTADIAVVALTAFAMAGDEQKALDAGCDGYITKPIDTRTLGDRIREVLDRRAESRAVPTPKQEGPETADGDRIEIPAAELLALRRRFLEEGQAQVRQWLLDLDRDFSPKEAARTVHQWIGAGGLLGYTGISRLSREMEAILIERPLDQNQLRESLINLALSFTTPREARDPVVPLSIAEALSGKRVAMVGLPANEEQRLTVALERAGARTVTFLPSDRPTTAEVESCQAVVVHVRPETTGTAWLDPRSSIAVARPLVVAGNRDRLLGLDKDMQALAVEFLMDPWQPEEAVLRLSHAASTSRAPLRATVAEVESAPRRPVVLLADDDPTVLALVRAAIQNFGMECHVAAEGHGALEIIRRFRPQVAVLDVNMPGMNGFEVLTTVRAEDLEVRVLLLTARQQESDVLRGFALGADDYVGKPFSPMELIARLKRLVSR